MTVDEIMAVVDELGLSLGWKNGGPVVTGGEIPKELLAVLKLRRRELIERLRPADELPGAADYDGPPWGGAPPPDSDLWMPAAEWKAMWESLKALENRHEGGRAT